MHPIVKLAAIFVIFKNERLSVTTESHLHNKVTTIFMSTISSMTIKYTNRGVYSL